jgi:hypothetical protein
MTSPNKKSCKPTAFRASSLVEPDADAEADPAAPDGCGGCGGGGNDIFFFLDVSGAGVLRALSCCRCGGGGSGGELFTSDLGEETRDDTDPADFSPDSIR